MGQLESVMASWYGCQPHVPALDADADGALDLEASLQEPTTPGYRKEWWR
jgi:hypothetical protein